MTRAANGYGDDEGFLVEERRALLPLLIPPIVHGLNNSLAILHGILEYGSDASPTPELSRMEGSLRHLTLFAKDLPERVDLFDVRTVLEACRSLVVPLAHCEGVELLVAGPDATPVVRADTYRIPQLLIALVATEVLAVAKEFEASHETALDEQPVVRLAVRIASGRVVVSLVRPSDGVGDRPPALLGASHEMRSAFEVDASMRTMGAATCYRLVFPSAEERASIAPAPRRRARVESGERHEVAPRPRTGPRVVLVEHDELLNELVTSVLVEAGYRVDSRPEASTTDELYGDGEDLVLVDTDHERMHPGILDALCEDERARERTLLLGAVPRDPDFTGFASLRKPFRPQQLLDALSTMADVR